MTQQSPVYDLLLRGGTLLDPAQNLHDRRDVAFRVGRVAAVEERIDPASAREALDVAGKLVTPGLIDIHGHYYHGAYHRTVNPRTSALPAGVTTGVDAGSAGWATYVGLREYVAPACGVRLYALLHICPDGLTWNFIAGGELRDPRHIDVDRTAQHVLDNPGFVLGVKVRMHADAVPYWEARRVLHAAREAADKSKSILMVHVSFTPIPLKDIVDVLGPGDVLTHVYNGNPHNILDANRKVHGYVREAAERGVIMDVAHAGVHFDVNVCRAALDQGLLPHTISTDIHTPPAGRVVYQMHDLISKLAAMGMPLEDAVAASTVRPARVLGVEQEIGALRVGMAGDAAIYDMAEGRHSWRDMAGNTVEGDMRLDTFATVRDGAVVWRRE